MASIKEEIAAIAADHGYTGPKPKSTAGAIDALADTLAGTDVKSGRTIAGAIHALAPYIGSGGGGAALGAGYELTVTGSTYSIDASDQPMTLGEQGPEGIKLSMLCRETQNNVPGAQKTMMPAGMHVILSAGEGATYTVQGVEYEVVYDGFGIQFVMPENAVSIDIDSHGTLG